MPLLWSAEKHGQVLCVLKKFSDVCAVVKSCHWFCRLRAFNLVSGFLWLVLVGLFMQGVPLKDSCSGKLANVVARSEQNLVDCCLSKGHEGCHGGLINYAFQYGKDSRSLDSEQSDPYHALVNGAPSLIKVEHFQGNDITYLLLTV